MKYLGKVVIPLIILVSAVLLLISYTYIQIVKNPQGTIQATMLDLEPVWNFETTEVITSTPVIDGSGKVYIRTSDSVLALDTLSGKLLWESASPSNIPLNVSPQVLGNLLIVPEKGSRVAAFDIDTGNLRWRTPAIDPVLTHPQAIEIEAISLGDDLIYVARFNWTLTAYRLNDGEIAWEQETFGRSNPYIASDQKTVYLGMGPVLKAFDSDDGTFLWQKELDIYIGPILRVDNILYVIDEAHSSLYAIDLSNQEIQWMNSYVEAEQFEFGCLSESGDNLLIAAQKLIAVSKSDGQIIWLTDNLGRLECPVTLNNDVFIRNTSDTLYRFDLNTGKETGRLKVSSNSSMKHEPHRSPTSVKGLLIVPVNESQIICYRP